MTQAPLTPSDCDLRDFSWFPLEVVRLRDSDLAANEAPEACWAAVLLWAACWHQIPAASMPNDERWIAKAAGYVSRGKIDKAWPDVRPGAMRGFVLCSDGRWYHPVMASKAREAWLGKLKQRWITECARVKKYNQRNGTDLHVPDFEDWLALGCPQGQQANVPRDTESKSQGTPPQCPGNVPRETHSNRKGEGQGEGQGYTNTETNRHTESTRVELADDDCPSHWDLWRKFFEYEHGIEHDPHDHRDRSKLRKYAQPWIKAGITVGQMRRAIAKAKAESTEPIAYLPAYVDRVLAGLNAPSSTARPPSRVEGAAAAIFDTGNNHGEVIDA